ncbi:hypothetical protein COL40_11620 [Bacillus toyonensis]|uniref:hypothetical protein n=1 Tax=Bacillus toyonensis TaxID=155322 RepID=UPI000BF6EEE9|nr:hypothetical protein [Bacillus toyonensis]PFX88117.1 hypothetical protein COL40_11620 [Bacillus toyonensis]
MTTTIQISMYDYSLKKELVYETEVGSIEDMVTLSYRYEKRVKYRKPTDKRWYHCKTMIKRLFKKELESKPFEVNLVEENDLDKALEEYHRPRLEREKKEAEYEKFLGQFDYREGREGFGNREYRGESSYDWSNEMKNEPKFTIEQIKSMSESELVSRLCHLYIEDFYIDKTGCDSYDGPFETIITEVAYIELQLSSELADQAHYNAMEFLCGGKLEYEPKRLPKSETFRLTDDYELVLIKKDEGEDLVPSF